MRNLKSIKTIAVCVIMLLADACKKSSVVIDDLTVNISSPTEGTTYTNSMIIAFDIASVKGLDSCTISLQDAASSLFYYVNNFSTGAVVRNKNSYTYSYNLTGAFPSPLTAAKFNITVVDLQKNRFTKTINVNVID